MEFLKGAAVNRDMAEVVAKLQESIARAREEASGAAGEEGEEGVAAVDEGGEEGVAGVDEEAEEGAGVSDGEGASDAAIVSEDAAPAAAPEQPASSAETGPREPAISAHQVEALSPIPPSVPAPPSQQGACLVGGSSTERQTAAPSVMRQPRGDRGKGSCGQWLCPGACCGPTRVMLEKPTPDLPPPIQHCEQTRSPWR